MDLVHYLTRCIPFPDPKEKPASPHANWIIPGRVACGVYPFLDGANFPTMAHAEKNMGDLAADGIDTFICLQSEIDQDGNLVGKHNYFPKFEFYPKKYPKVRFHHFPIPDGHACNPEGVRQVVQVILRAMFNGKNVYVHCAGGHGRTGLIVAALLATLYPSLSWKRLLHIVQTLHDGRGQKDVRTSHVSSVASPNTREQAEVLQKYRECLRKTGYVFRSK